jgi:hypothetical protein
MAFVYIPTSELQEIIEGFIICTMKSLSTKKERNSKENIPFSLNFMEHIFGEQLELIRLHKNIT